MFHDATRQYFYLPELETRSEQERVIAAALIARMFKDYHEAKRLIKQDKTQGVRWGRKLVSTNFDNLDGELRALLMRGKLAGDWLKNEPMRRNPRKLTLQDCCDVLHLDIHELRDVFLRPSAWRAYCEVENRTKCRPRTNKNYSQFNFEGAA
jgi:hypothetical protein